MRSYLLIAAALFMGGVGVASTHASFVGALLFPIPVALYAALGWPVLATGLVLAAGLGGWVATGVVGEGVHCGLITAVGFPLGVGIGRRWTYGWTVTAVAGFTYLVVLGSIVNAWDMWIEQARAVYDALLSQLQSQAPASPEGAELLVQNVGWLKDHWAQLGAGLLLWPVIVEACLGVSIIGRWMQRRSGLEGVRGSFRTMRISEWLVWLAILVAGLCYAAYRSGNVPLGLVAWNAAVALAGIYWFNGFSVCAYAIDALRPQGLLYLAIVVGMVWAVLEGFHPALCVVGFFDTWADFRTLADRWAAARKRREEAMKNEDEDE